MKKFSFFLLILLLTRVGTTYAAPNNGTTLDFHNFFLGSSTKANVNVNQVLALLVGPEGEPGAAGVAGRDGFVGMNGQDGLQGLAGAPGPVGLQGPAGEAGEAGASVIAVALTSGDTNCANGGSKFIAGDGSTTFACNGAAGEAGAAGAAGVPGTPGTKGDKGDKGEKGDPGEGGTGGGGFSAGVNGIAGCSETIGFSVIHHYSNTDKEFLLDGFKLKGLNVACLDIGNFAKFNLSIQNTAAKYYADGLYDRGDDISCSNEITKDVNDAALAAKDGSDNLDFIFGNASLLTGQIKINPTCRISRMVDTVATDFGPISLSNISTRDLGDTVAFEFSPAP